MSDEKAELSTDSGTPATCGVTMGVATCHRPKGHQFDHQAITANGQMSWPQEAKKLIVEQFDRRPTW